MNSKIDLRDAIRRTIDESLESAREAEIHKERRFPRSRVVWKAELQGHQQSVEGTVQDMSVNGAKFESKEHFYENKKLKLTIGRFGALNCDVIWRENGALGLQFKETPEQVLNLIGSVLPGIRDYDG